MSAPTLPFARAKRFSFQFDGYNALPFGAREVWHFIWTEFGFGREEVKITDREIAAHFGKSIRWAQRAIHDLVNATLDGVTVAARYFKHGPRHVAGRHILITVEWPAAASKGQAEGDKASPPAAATASRPGGRGKGTKAAEPIPNVDNFVGATPERAAAAAAQIAAAEAEVAALPDELSLEARELMEAARKRREAARRKAGPTMAAAADAGAPIAKTRAAIEAKRREMAALADAPPPGSIQAALGRKADELGFRAVPEPDDTS